MSSSFRHQRSPHEEEEEDECRICRGPAEEERPLYKPCKCSGSIAMTHQDCLKSWLEVKGGNGKCDLCKTKFHFAPRYAEDTPETLSTLEVISGIGLRAASRWLPRALRILLVAFVWLGILPLVTAYVYQGWMHKPSSIKTRLDWTLLPGDLVSGAVLTVTIIVTFLSLMSLGDFFRFNWQGGEVVNNDGTLVGNDTDGNDDADVQIAPVQVGEDRETLYYDSSTRSLSEKFDAENHIIEKMVRESNKSVMDGGQMFHRYKKNSIEGDRIDSCSHHGFQEMETFLAANGGDDDNDFDRVPADHIIEDEMPADYGGVAAVRRQRHRRALIEAGSELADTGMTLADMRETEPRQNSNEDDEDSMYERMMRLQEAENEEPEEEDNHNVEPEVPENGRFEPQFERLDRVFEEDDAMMDAEAQMPLAQIIGLRGPISDLFRNLVWLLAFETTFIGIFGVIPRSIGSLTFNQLIFRSGTISRTLGFLVRLILFAGFDLNLEDGQPIDLIRIIKIITEENEKCKSLLRPDDLAKITFGYIAMAIAVFIVQTVLWAAQQYSKSTAEDQSTPIQDDIGRNNIDDIRFGLGGQVPIMRDHRERLDPDALRPEEMQAYLVDKLRSAVNCAAAISKISFLVCFKMFILPFLLGSWLDLSTLELFDASIDQRFAHAGVDIVGFFLVHWVVGITFMLTVTVSVLQLREVLHPDLLAPSIRPQEPQPDLLVTLLADSGWTHAKRMVPSLGIYAVILAIYVWLPCQCIWLLSIQTYIPMFRPQFWYLIYRPLQRPIELLAFHLTVLSVLERHKNSLGELQHSFLLKVSGFLGITDCVLPKNITKFCLIGERPVHAGRSVKTGILKVDEFWDQLIAIDKKNGACDELMESEMHLVDSASVVETFQKTSNPDHFILLSRNPDEDCRKLMPTRIGSYRFQKKIKNDGQCVIEIWRAEVGDPIPRPPEGWDYLADGGAVEQGRWAWGKKERKSDIEQRVAKRRHFFPDVFEDGHSKAMWKTPQVLVAGIPMAMKLIGIAFASWIAVAMCASAALFAPLMISRCCVSILRVPSTFVHDPILFCVGGIMLAPLCPVLFRFFCVKQREEIQHSSKKHRTFSLPPLRKLIVLLEAVGLWFGLCPLIAGTVYHYFFSTVIPGSFDGFNTNDLLNSWPVGILLMHFWAVSCYVGAFQKDFWIKIRQLAIDGIAGGAVIERVEARNEAPQQRARNNDEGANNEAAALNDNNNGGLINPETKKGTSSSWQGDDGFVATFAITMYAIMVKQEWDKINQIALLSDFLVPVTQQLCMMLLAPACAVFMAIVGTSFSSDMAQIFEEEVFRMSLYRYAVLFVIVIQLTVCFQSSLASWYKSAHNAARDHRYLVGEILLNYKTK